MTVIQFRPKKDVQPAPQSIETGRIKPNFEDPHSKDFFEEPKYNKAALMMPLEPEERMALLKLRNKLSLTASFGCDQITLTKTIDAEESGVSTLNGQSIVTLRVAEIFKNESDHSALTYSYRLAQTQEENASMSLLSLLVQLENHIETGSPDLPEPNIWR